MTQVTGQIEAITHKFEKWNMLLDDGVWYSTKLEWAPKPEPSRGDQVSFDNGGKKYVKNLKVMGAGEATSAPASTGKATTAKSGYRQNGQEGGFPIHPLAYERALDRRNALNAAVSLYNTQYSEMGSTLKMSEITTDVLELAMTFEDYTTGSADARMADDMLKNGDIPQ